jgi:hypothetical protein
VSGRSHPTRQQTSRRPSLTTHVRSMAQAWQPRETHDVRCGVSWITDLHLPFKRHSRFSAVSPSGVPGQCLAKASGPAARVVDRNTSATMMASSA